MCLNFFDVQSYYAHVRISFCHLLMPYQNQATFQLLPCFPIHLEGPLSLSVQARYIFKSFHQSCDSLQFINTSSTCPLNPWKVFSKNFVSWDAVLHSKCEQKIFIAQKIDVQYILNIDCLQWAQQPIQGATTPISSFLGSSQISSSLADVITCFSPEYQ